MAIKENIVYCDYAYENIPLYRKKYDAIGFKKGI